MKLRRLGNLRAFEAKGTNYALYVEKGITAMDHEVVVREKVTEKYLLDELVPDVRDEFEEHFFDCPECALDVRAGSAFIEKAKRVLAETRVAEPAASVPVKPGWPGWLRPVYTVPVLALLLAFIGYQNLITYPSLRQAQNRPQVLPWASVNIGTWGASGPVITTAPGEGFLLFVRIPPGGGYARYVAELHDPDGKLAWSVTIPGASAQDQWSIHVPGADRQAGDCTLAVRGISTAGESKEVGRASFVLQIQR